MTSNMIGRLPISVSSLVAASPSLGRKAFPFQKSLSSFPRNLSAFLRRIIFIGKAILGAGMDLKWFQN
jgi:hypothetical protein